MLALKFSLSKALSEKAGVAERQSVDAISIAVIYFLII